jgi:probable F420-dependent oxidoreductase
VQLGVSLEPPRWTAQDGGALIETARKAERLGFHSVLMSGHTLRNGNGSALDPLVLLSAVAGATTRLNLATSVLVAPYYPPVLLANQAAALDVLSQGRFVLGVGAGWNPAEFAAVGVAPHERGARTDEALAVLTALWTGDPVDYKGRSITLRGAVGGVVPYTPGGPPIWVGGHSEAALRRTVRFAEGWHGSGVDHREAARVRARLAELAEQAGRDPDTLRLSTVAFLVPPGIAPDRPAPGRPLGGAGGGAAEVVEELGLLREAGVSLCSLWMPLSGPQLSDALDWAAAELLPALA